MLWKQLFLRPGRYRVGDSLRTITATDLRRYADGTRKMLKAGLEIPVLTAHTKPGDPDGGPQVSRSALDTLGWVKGISQAEDGCLKSNLEITNTDAQARVGDGTIKFTSPELVDNVIDGDGKAWGPGIRHFAFTPKPRNRHQTTEALQFSLDDYEGPIVDDATTDNGDTTQFAFPDDKDKDRDKREEQPGVPVDEPTEATSEPAPNPDMPADNKAAQKWEAIVANLSQLGVELPADWTMDSDGGPDVLLTGLKTAVAAQQKAEETDDEEPITVTEQPNQAAQFSEDPQVQSVWEERNALRAEKSKTDLAGACKGLPPALKQALQAESIQFDEDGATRPTFTPQQVAELVKKTIPPDMLQFAETKAEANEADHPEGEKFFDDSKEGEMSADRANEIANTEFGNSWSREKGGSTYTNPNANSFAGKPQPERAGAK